MVAEEQDQDNMNVSVNRALEALEKEYVIIGKRRLRGWQVWLLIGLIAGIIAGIVAVATRTREPGGEYEFITVEAASALPPPPPSPIPTPPELILMLR